MTNQLSLAARNNEAAKVAKLLNESDPHYVDQNGWNCLHQAAAADSYESVLVILAHKSINPTVQTYDAQTPLCLACQFKSSLKTITALLRSAPDVIDFGISTTPLHLESFYGRNEIVNFLIKNGANINNLDYHACTPLHDAALGNRIDTIKLLLHAGANPNILNKSGYSPFHLACFKGFHDLIPTFCEFISNINQVTANGDTPLIVAAEEGKDKVVLVLLEKKADPNIKNNLGELALTTALNQGKLACFNILLEVTDLKKMDQSIIELAFEANKFNIQILYSLLNYTLDPQLYKFYKKCNFTRSFGKLTLSYHTNGPFISFLNMCQRLRLCDSIFCELLYVLLKRGFSVNAEEINECPPLVYMQYCSYPVNFKNVLEILLQHGCDLDYCSIVPQFEHNNIVPDAILASITSNHSTIFTMITYSMQCDPEIFIYSAIQNSFLCILSNEVQSKLLEMIDLDEIITVDQLAHTVMPLSHLCRKLFREMFKIENYKYIEFYQLLVSINTPDVTREYLCYRFCYKKNKKQ